MALLVAVVGASQTTPLCEGEESGDKGADPWLIVLNQLTRSLSCDFSMTSACI